MIYKTDWREMEVSSKKGENRRLWKKDKNNNPQGKRGKEMESVKKENLQQPSSEQPACDQHLNHSWRLTPSPLEEVNCSGSPCERLSKHEAREHVASYTDIFYREPCYNEA